MNAAILIIMQFVILAVGLVAGATIEGHLAKSRGGIDKHKAKRYREAAKILDDLIHIDDLNTQLPVLPQQMQNRVELWLEAHNKALNEGK